MGPMRIAMALLVCLIVAPLARAQAPVEEQAIAGEVGASPELDAPEAEPAPDAPAEREARLRFEAGQLAREQGRMEQALEDFRRAQELAPSTDRLWAVTQALEALRRDGELIETYRVYLQLAPPDDPRLAELRARLAVLEGASLEVPPPAPASEALSAVAPEPAAPEHEHTVLDEPWFWAVLAIGAAGIVGGLLFGTASPGMEAPIPGDEGVVVRTLVELP
jgi:tetratricopeptide (TPR) repeat protein